MATDFQIRERVEELARLEGFDLVGWSPVTRPPDAGRFEAWLDAGMHGEMAYLERFRERIVEPSRVLAGARSILCLALNHARAPGGFRGGGRVARYALGRDYHAVLGRMVRSLVRRLRAEGIGSVYRDIVDAGPVLERSHAARAGLGFASKGANVLHHRFGPWLFLAELFLDVDPPEETKKAPGSCGTCTKCLDLCPTGAIVEAGRVDARICISYLTIETQGSIPLELRPKMGDWVFGCDVCSEVCPFGDGAPDAAARFGTHGALALSLEELLRLDDANFVRAFEGSPMRRAKRQGIARNACIALGNLGRAEARPALEESAERDPSAVVREAAAWALGRLR